LFSSISGLFKWQETTDEKRDETKKISEAKYALNEGLEQFVNVWKLEGGSICKHNIDVKVSKVEYIPGGFMSFSYIDITIETNPYEWKVIRRE